MTNLPIFNSKLHTNMYLGKINQHIQHNAIRTIL